MIKKNIKRFFALAFVGVFALMSALLTAPVIQKEAKAASVEVDGGAYGYTIELPNQFLYNHGDTVCVPVHPFALIIGTSSTISTSSFTLRVYHYNNSVLEYTDYFCSNGSTYGVEVQMYYASSGYYTFFTETFFITTLNLGKAFNTITLISGGISGTSLQYYVTCQGGTFNFKFSTANPASGSFFGPLSTTNSATFSVYPPAVKTITTEDLNEYYDRGYDTGYINGNNEGYQLGFSEGQNQGYNTGFGAGKNEGYNNGYAAGVTAGGNNNFMSLITAVVDAPIKAFTSLLDFDILGYNMKNLALALLTAGLLVAAIRFFSRL